MYCRRPATDDSGIVGEEEWGGVVNITMVWDHSRVQYIVAKKITTRQARHE